jgi:hypothetical protein
MPMGKHFVWWPMEDFQWLVTLGRFQAWWPLEGEGKTSFSPLFTFPLNKFYLNLFYID